MRISFGSPMALVVATALIYFCRASAAISVSVDDLDPLKTCKRRDVRLIESDNKVYMYGGQSWVKNGTEEPFEITNHYLRIVDFTRARNLSDPSIMTAKDIPGNITIFQRGAFWADTKKAYVVGGCVNDGPWLSRQGEFLPSNFSAYKGGTIFSYEIEADKWSAEPAVQPTNGSGVTDAFCSGSFAYNARSRKAYVYSGNNAAGARKLDPVTAAAYVGRTREEVVANANLLTFDTANFKWSNVTTDQRLTTTGTENGQFVYLPGTETSSGGIGILLGGRRKNTDSMESMRKVLVYDSGTGSWYAQATTADGSDFPDGRWHFCAVAASAPDNSSHNIYVYGGESRELVPDALDDMWILSVPSFHWLRVDVDSVPRKSVGCTTVAERYMVTYGGTKPGWGKEGDEDECDQENYGLRLFDMSSLAWTSRYEGPPSGTHAFTVPKRVFDAIGGNKQGNATQTAPTAGFETPGLASLFQKSRPMSSTSPSLPTDSTSTISSKKSTNTGAIAGGVGVGLAVIGIVVLGVFCLMRRRKKRSTALSTIHEADGESNYLRELAATGRDSKDNTYELCADHREPQELCAGYVSPLPQNVMPTHNI